MLFRNGLTVHGNCMRCHLYGYWRHPGGLVCVWINGQHQVYESFRRIFCFIYFEWRWQHIHPACLFTCIFFLSNMINLSPQASSVTNITWLKVHLWHYLILHHPYQTSNQVHKFYHWKIHWSISSISSLASNTTAASSIINSLPTKELLSLCTSPPMSTLQPVSPCQRGNLVLR